MSGEESTALRMAKGAALVFSMSVGVFVVVNAQFGCDSPTKSPQQEQGEPAAAQPAAAEPAAVEPAGAEPAAAAPEPEPAVEPAANTDPAAKNPSNANAEPANIADKPVLMPASKSGGDFGSMKFPGEAPQQQQQQPKQGK